MRMWESATGNAAEGWQRYDPAGMTSDPAPFVNYECVCVRGEDDRWRRATCQAGFSPETPTEIEAKADAIRAESS
jgi:hypothetical protein